MLNSPHFVLAPDKFKGTLAASEVSDCLRQGIESAIVGADIRSVPVADGGDGTLEVAWSTGFERVVVTAAGPLSEPRIVPVAIRENEAVIELAAICGLQLLTPDTYQPEVCTTLGLGLAIRAVLDFGCTRLTIGIGGSSSTDGGTGLLHALGAEFLDDVGRPFVPVPANLHLVCTVDLSGLDPRLEEVDIQMAVDVDSPLLGPHGAASVFAPQKGADADAVRRLENGLARWAAVLAAAFPGIDPTAPGSGAAGGVGFVSPVLGASINSGGELLLDLALFDEAVADAVVVITGEGRLDEQTFLGKAPARIARRSAALGVPVVAVVGSHAPSVSDEQLRTHGFESVYALVDEEPDAAVDIEASRSALRAIGARIALTYARADAPDPDPRPEHDAVLGS